MNRPIASFDGRAYPCAMMSRAVRLLTLMALVLMPFTMAAAPAEAHAMPQGMSEEHCGDHQQPETPATDLTQCLLMCAALPAAEPINVSAPEMIDPPRQQALAQAFHGVILDIATPPPRFS